MTTAPPPPEPLLAFGAAVPKLSSRLTRIDSMQSGYRELRASGGVPPGTIEAMRVELTYHSNAIEGNTLSLRDTQLIIEGLAPSGGKSMREIYEARNHDRALRTVENWAQTRPPSSPLTTPDLLNIHAIVMTDIDPDGAGCFRSHRVLIAGSHFVPPGSQKFDELIPRMLELANPGCAVL